MISVLLLLLFSIIEHLFMRTTIILSSVQKISGSLLTDVNSELIKILFNLTSDGDDCGAYFSLHFLYARAESLSGRSVVSAPSTILQATLLAFEDPSIYRMMSSKALELKSKSSIVFFWAADRLASSMATAAA